jgi:hypothetical protein
MRQTGKNRSRGRVAVKGSEIIIIIIIIIIKGGFIKSFLF